MQGNHEKLMGASQVVHLRSREVFEASYAEFLADVLAYWGARSDQRGIWFAMGSDRLRVAAQAIPWNHSPHEPGWSRWALPSQDGVTRSRLHDNTAPWVELAPSGALFLHCHRRKAKRLELGKLLDAVAEHCLKVQAERGWPAREKVAP